MQLPDGSLALKNGWREIMNTAWAECLIIVASCKPCPCMDTLKARSTPTRRLSEQPTEVRSNYIVQCSIEDTLMYGVAACDQCMSNQLFTTLVVVYIASKVHVGHHINSKLMFIPIRTFLSSTHVYYSILD